MAAIPRAGSELEALVATEAQLDRRIAAARAHANELREAARRSAAQDEVALEAELVAEHTRIARDGDLAACAAARAIEDEARDAIARYEAVAGPRLAALAARLAARVADMSSEEVAR